MAPQSPKETSQNTKRFRRNATQIQRDYKCMCCKKEYGSEGSLNQHIKLKHPAYASKLCSVSLSKIKNKQGNP
jgi:hypothetical protein